MCVFANPPACVGAFYHPPLPPPPPGLFSSLWSSLAGAAATCTTWRGSSLCSTSAAGEERCTWLLRSGLSGEVRAERRQGKKEVLNDKTELIACGQYGSYRLQEAVGAHRRGGSGWAVAQRRRGAAGWGIPRHQQAGGVCRHSRHNWWSATLQQTQPGAQVGQVHEPCSVYVNFSSLFNTFGSWCCGAEAGVYWVTWLLYGIIVFVGEEEYQGFDFEDHCFRRIYEISGRVSGHGGIC